MSEHKISGSGALLDQNGCLREPGWSFQEVFTYDRDHIKALKVRIKEWDYYLVNDDAYAVCLTVSDLGYVGLISASVIDYATKTYKTTSEMVPLPMGRFNMPCSSESGDVCYRSKRCQVAFCHVTDALGRPARRVSFYMDSFEGKDELEVELLLYDMPRDSMVIATPWAEDPLAFYYNRKILGMRAKGGFRRGAYVHEFESADDATTGPALGLLDWGRGVWTYDNTWYWAEAQGVQQGPDDTMHIVALNLGYGFGDTSAASENMVFIDGRGHKLGRVDFGIPENSPDSYSYLKSWHMSDDEGRLDLTFKPDLDRRDYVDVFHVMTSDQHQVFGTLDGHIILDDGTVWPIQHLRGAAEHIHNKY